MCIIMDNKNENSSLANLYGTNNNVNSSPTNFNQSVNSNIQNTNQVNEQVNHPDNINQVPNQTINNFQNNTPNNNSVPPIDSLTEEDKKKNEIIDSYIYNNSSNNEISDDEEYLKAFVGKNYEKIKNNNISIPAFFFTELYFFYRKMFAIGFIIGIIHIIIINSSFFYLGIIINILSMLFVNKIYLLNANNKINKIKASMGASSKEEILNKCTTKGGTSVGLVVGGIILECIIMIIFLIISLFSGFLNLMNSGFLSDFAKSINSAISNGSNYSGEVDAEFDGTIFYDSNINVNDKISINVPEVFVSDGTGSYEYSYSFNSNPNGTFGNCDVSLGIVSNFSNPEILAKGMAKFYNNNENITTSNINGITWYGLTYSSFYNTTAYVMSYDNKVYLYEFEMGSDADQVTCQAYNEQIFNSISLK